VIAGFVVNPIAGMGGAVGLKGTDGQEVLANAVAKGATRSAPDRAIAALRGMASRRLSLEFVTCAGEMGKDELDAAGVDSLVVHSPSGRTTRQDTVDGVRAFVDRGAELVIFVGGDGTARDVLEAVDQRVPIVGVPAGVKMHSAVFVNTPEELADVAQSFLRSRRTRDAEVMDVDETAFRAGVASAKLFGFARVPDDPAGMQSSKTAYHSGTADDEAAEIGQYVFDSMRDGVTYVIGPGSTTAAIAKAAGTEKTLLGVDVFRDRKLVWKDADEATLLELLSGANEAEIIVTPIGSQGFFLGRGNQQISARVLEAVGLDRITVVATPTKLKGTPVLRIDTGDNSLDGRLRGRRRVVTGYKRKRLVTVR